MARNRRPKKFRPADLADGITALRAMMAETALLQSVLPGSTTDAVAAWLAPQYALAARKQLAAAETGEEHFEILRKFVGDWSLLRQGDQMAERLQLEHERMVLRRHDSLSKYKRKVIIGLECFHGHIKKNPEAKAAFDKLAALLRHPFDAEENPTESE